MRRWRILALGLAVVFLLTTVLVAGCGGKKESGKQEQPSQSSQTNQGKDTGKKLKVALLLPGPINDNGWNASAYEGLKKAGEELGVETAYRERVSQSDQVDAFRAYATQGYDVIIGHGFEFGDAAKRVAKDFPNVKFVVTSSDISQAPNVASLQVMNVEAGFFGGALAGLVTKTGKVGYVGGMEIPPITNALYGFKAGAKYVNPKVEVKTALTGSFEDVAKAKETATAFIQQGADVVLGNADQAGLGVVQAAKEKGVMAVGYDHDQSNVAPETIVGTSIQSYPIAIVDFVKLVMDGKFEAKFYPMGVKEGATGIIWNPSYKLPDGVKDKMTRIIEDAKAGKIDIQKLADAEKEKK
ncbi:ABC transporter substrate-binding protein PnrA-like protein [Neomoorella glycerini]|uniref:ABC transporter substrate-binding protein PnrA-like protein n=1 Tax=Neomoorella glycerini TaxID=55779 RepID=A0A6I5ZNM8_9FIRM|nr:BMP family protein [Moorella glycerini]QGP91207.1 ABC transporter substrate-binding protein PnrA-like protein [Moorella glycerini]